jgi:hypothetical protein
MMYRRIATALLGALIVCSLALPAQAQDRKTGSYANVRFANTTNWCVWFTVWASDNSSPLYFVTAQNVKPLSVVSVKLGGTWVSQKIRIKSELYQYGNCTGTTVGKTEITKLATQPQGLDQKNMTFNAEAQLDYNGTSFNFYWGADKYLGTSN